MDVNIRIAGEAGQGVHTVGDLLVQVLAATGRHVFASQSYMSRIRGGLNWYDVRVSDQELFGGRERADLLVALIPEALEELAAEVTPGGMVLYDGPASEGVISLEFGKVAKEVAGNAVMANAVAAGAVFALLCYDLKPLEDYLRQLFARKGEEVVQQNLTCARQGAELAAPWSRQLCGPEPAGAPANVVDGSSSVGLGAATAGVKLVASYPMTPSTGVFTFLAGAADEFGIVVEQAEDEIAALNMVCGATYAGVPAMTTTSGGGFALMGEAMSLAGMLELPAVVLLSMRPGPATGLPTRTGQEDLRFVLHSGHGEYPKAILAPGSHEQCYELTRHALQLAHRYQTPVVVLIDQFLADQHKNLPAFDRTYRPIDRCLELAPGPDYVRYAVTDSGISPRAVPGGPAFVAVDSDEHTPDGHITERLDVRVAMVDKRLRKEQGMIAEALPPTHYGALEPETLLICWGSTYGPCREAVDLLQAQGHAVAMRHFAQVWPLPADIADLLQAPRVVVIEGNARGQFASLLRELGAVGPVEVLSKYDGMPFTGEEIAGKVVS